METNQVKIDYDGHTTPASKVDRLLALCDPGGAFDVKQERQIEELRTEILSPLQDKIAEIEELVRERLSAIYGASLFKSFKDGDVLLIDGKVEVLTEGCVITPMITTNDDSSPAIRYKYDIDGEIYWLESDKVRELPKAP
jgi:hypothetical protein